MLLLFIWLPIWHSESDSSVLLFISLELWSVCFISQYCAIALLQAESEGGRKLIWHIFLCSTWLRYFRSNLNSCRTALQSSYLQLSGGIVLKVLFSALFNVKLLKLYSIWKCMLLHYNQAPMKVIFCIYCHLQRAGCEVGFYWN